MLWAQNELRKPKALSNINNLISEINKLHTTYLLNRFITKSATGHDELFSNPENPVSNT